MYIESLTCQEGAQRPAERPDPIQRKKKLKEVGYIKSRSHVIVFGSSETVGSVGGSGVFPDGDVWFGKLDVDSVGEFADSDFVELIVGPELDGRFCDASLALRAL